MKIINLTPHEVVILKEDGTKMPLPGSKDPLRLSARTVKVGEIDGVAITSTEFGCPNTPLPEKAEDTIYIVSKIFLEAFPERSDFFIVNETVRNEEGAIIGCKSLSRL